jgi:DNA-binding response OmpR family regulator
MYFQLVQLLGDRPQRILVLVANGDLRDTACYAGKELGFAVDTARHGSHAARLLNEAEYHALITDRVVPPWPGLGGIPRLKRRYAGVRLVILLKQGPIGTASLLRVAGADAVVEAPIRQAALMTALRPL